MSTKRLFVELHEGHADRPTVIALAVDDIRSVRATMGDDNRLLAYSPIPERYQSHIMFKDGTAMFVHEPPHEVMGLCGFEVSR